jgi:hypothetical protein
MGLWDILYDMVKEYRAIKGDEEKKVLLAKSMARKAYLRFNLDWDTEKKSDRKSRVFAAQQEMLESYSQMYLDLAVEIIDILPEEGENLIEIATMMKKGACGEVTYSTNEVTPIGDECAEKVLGFVTKLD